MKVIKKIDELTFVQFMTWTFVVGEIVAVFSLLTNGPYWYALGAMIYNFGFFVWGARSGGVENLPDWKEWSQPTFRECINWIVRDAYWEWGFTRKKDWPTRSFIHVGQAYWDCDYVLGANIGPFWVSITRLEPLSAYEERMLKEKENAHPVT